MRQLLFFIIALLAIASCSSIDCPLNNTVHATYWLRGSADTLKDSLTVSVTSNEGADTVILNRLIATDHFTLPVSYTQAEDVLLFQFTDTAGTKLIDTVRIEKENTPHFEAVDCSPNYFHTITAIKTTHNKIDSLTINNPSVDYDATKQHIFVYLRPSN